MISVALSIPDYLRKPKKLSEKKGWKWDYRGSKHLMVFDHQGKPVVTISLTAYDGVLTKRVQSQLRKAGCPGL